MANFDLRSDERQETTQATTKKILFMGTGHFALPLLEVLIADKDNAQVVAVVTKPDAKVGRSKNGNRAIHENPIKEVALNHGVHVAQPQKLDAQTVGELAAFTPDLIIVASYGKILPKALLNIAPHGAINAHASLLPKLRGASPIQNDILLGNTETGVTIIQMDEGLDTGAILAQQSLPITPDAMVSEVRDHLAILSANLIRATLPKLFAKSLEAQAQDNTQATLCQIIDRQDGHIMWTWTGEDIYNRYRAFTPWPGLFTYWQKTPTETVRIKIHKLQPAPEITDLAQYTSGEVFAIENRLFVKTGSEAVEILELQREGKTLQQAKDFLNGTQEFIGAKLI